MRYEIGKWVRTCPARSEAVEILMASPDERVTIVRAINGPDRGKLFRIVLVGEKQYWEGLE